MCVEERDSSTTKFILAEELSKVPEQLDCNFKKLPGARGLIITHR